MPKTKLEQVIFTLMMVVLMVFTMSVYNIALQTGGLQYSTFAEALQTMLPLVVIAFVAEFSVVKKRAVQLTFRLFTPQDKPIFHTVAMAVFMVCHMAPLMALASVLMHHGLTPDWLILWLPQVVKNFPMALGLQLLLVGPLVRFMFRVLFRRESAPQREQASSMVAGK